MMLYLMKFSQEDEERMGPSWKNFHQTQYHMKILSFLYWVHTQDILFDAVEYQQRYRENPFCAW